MSNVSIKRGYWIPSENELYKAAYYDPSLNGSNGGYWTYPTQSDSNFEVLTPSYYGTYHNLQSNIREITDTTFENMSTGTSPSPRRVIVYRRVNKNNRDIADITATVRAAVCFRIACSADVANLSNFVSIGNEYNITDTTGYGNVNYIYKIKTYTVTNNEYVEFLNAIATTDTYEVYNTYMDSGSNFAPGGISRSGISGNYTYNVKSNMNNEPVFYVDWFDAARYCNWLTNGKPSGIQDNNTTETGSYLLYGTKLAAKKKTVK